MDWPLTVLAVLFLVAYASPMTRTMDTARLAIEPHGLPVQAVDGSVDAIDSGGYTLTTLAGSTRVITSVATVYSGAGSVALAPGARVHVSGYRRGDGVILATHVRVAIKR